MDPTTQREEISGVSVVIPTFRRPELLSKALESVLENDFRPIQIVVSNDAPGDDAPLAVLNELDVPDGIQKKYAETTGCGQAGNVLNGLNETAFEHIVLLHDDDLLLPKAIDHLVQAWGRAETRIDACYGFQATCDMHGRIDYELTNNRNFFRSMEFVGVQESPLWASLVAQFPNDGYMIRRSTALQIKFPSEEEVGIEPVDLFFGIRYALAAKAFLLIPEFTSVYRKSVFSILRSSRSRIRPARGDGFMGWDALIQVPISGDLERDGLKVAANRLAPSAIFSLLYAGQIAAASRIWRNANVVWPKDLKAILKACMYFVIGAVDRAAGLSRN